MQASLWQQRAWQLVGDMNGDGAVNMADAGLWAQSVFFLPGDALIAQFGPTELGRAIGLTQGSFGGAMSAGLSAALWTLGVLAVIYAFWFVLDAIDPTYRQQQREMRQARSQARRAARAGSRQQREPQRRIEPTLADDRPAAAPQEAEARSRRPRRIAA